MVMAGVNPPPSAAQPLPLIVPGTLAVMTGKIKIPAMANYQILGMQATCGTPSVGADVIVDFLVNGVSVFTNQANRPTVHAGVDASAIVVPDVVTVTAGSLLSMNIVQVGSTSPGTDLCLMVMFQATQ